MPSARRFPPPWIVEEHSDACFIVRGATGQALGYFYFEEEFGRRSTDVRFRATAVIGCVPSETARSRMTHFGSGVCVAARPPMRWVSTTD
jgi:hypothetical protein